MSEIELHDQKFFSNFSFLFFFQNAGLQKIGFLKTGKIKISAFLQRKKTLTKTENRIPQNWIPENQIPENWIHENRNPENRISENWGKLNFLIFLKKTQVTEN